MTARQPSRYGDALAPPTTPWSTYPLVIAGQGNVGMEILRQAWTCTHIHAYTYTARMHTDTEMLWQCSSTIDAPWTAAASVPAGSTITMRRNDGRRE